MSNISVKKPTSSEFHSKVQMLLAELSPILISWLNLLHYHFSRDEGHKNRNLYEGRWTKGLNSAKDCNIVLRQS